MRKTNKKGGNLPKPLPSFSDPALKRVLEEHRNVAQVVYILFLCR